MKLLVYLQYFASAYMQDYRVIIYRFHSYMKMTQEEINEYEQSALYLIQKQPLELSSTLINPLYSCLVQVVSHKLQHLDM